MAASASVVVVVVVVGLVVGLAEEQVPGEVAALGKAASAEHRLQPSLPSFVKGTGDVFSETNHFPLR